MSDLGRWIISAVFRLRKAGTPATAVAIASDLKAEPGAVAEELRVLRDRRVLECAKRNGLWVWGPWGNV